MQFDSFSAFLHMGGYGFYVWLSYGVTAFLLAWLFISSKIQHKRVLKQIKKRQQREDKLRFAAEQHNNNRSQAHQHSDDPKEALL